MTYAPGGFTRASRSVLIAWLGTATCWQAATAQANLTRIGNQVDSLVNREMASRQIDGAAVLVMSKGRILKQAGYGIANSATGERVTPTTAFFIASITKAFTSATVLGLVEDGQLRLDDSVGALIPGLPIAWRGATIRQLLGVTSGLPETARDPGRGISWPDYQTAIDSAAGRPVDPPGTTVRDGAGYILLGKVIERITNRPFPEAVQTRILRPLALTSAAFGDWRVIRPGRAEWYSVYDLDKKEFSTKKYLLRTDYPAYHWSSAGMFINAVDLATYVRALASGRVLGAAMTKAYWEPVSLKDGTKTGMLLGSWGDAGDELPGHVVFHEGGVRASVAYARDADLIVVVLTNLQGGLPVQWVSGILALYSAPGGGRN